MFLSIKGISVQKSVSKGLKANIYVVICGCCMLAIDLKLNYVTSFYKQDSLVFIIICTGLLYKQLYSVKNYEFYVFSYLPLDKP
jgi:hypothetical protein